MGKAAQIIGKIAAEQGRILVVGLGISGIETARLLLRKGIKAICIERSGEDRLNAKYAAAVSELRAAGVEIHFGIDGENVRPLTKGASLAVISPGVGLESAVCGALKRDQISLMGELELGVELLAAPSLVVTGSNGKSTTVTLLAHLLQRAGFEALLCGNVGTPVVSYVGRELSDRARLVVEASSYQLESCALIKPRVGVLLNLSDNHLERHGTIERYRQAKANLFARQTAEDFAILNFDDPAVRALAVGLKARALGITKDARLSKNPGAVILYDRRRGEDFVRINITGTDEDYELNGSRLIGLHNRYNIAAALLAARAAGSPADRLADAVREFKPLEHRLEHLTAPAGPLIINDSKSTTVAATVAAVRAIREEYPTQKIKLMIGGLAKAGSWDPLMKFLGAEKKFLEPLICFGKDGNILASHCRASGLPYQIGSTLAAGVELAAQEIAGDRILLLSPGCASFDEFTDFEDRGNVFKSLVANYSGRKK